MSRVLSTSSIVMIRCMGQEHALPLRKLKMMAHSWASSWTGTKATFKLNMQPQLSQLAVLQVLDQHPLSFRDFANWALCPMTYIPLENYGMLLL